MAFRPDQLRKEYESIKNALDDGGVRSEANRRYSSENKRRIEAGKGDHKRTAPTFLRPQDIQKGVDFDFNKVYLTTMGKGELRVLTRDDLIAFKKNIDLLQDNYKKGITAKQVINLSLPSDIERANKQIHLVIPQSIKAGVVHFMTNASNESHVAYHHVDIEFIGYSSLALKPSQVTINDVRQNLSLGKIKFQCDCQRHTYWYRFMASIGGYNYGRYEEGFPKIRNPELVGTACKHVLRVMKYILSPQGDAYLFKSLKVDRDKQFGQRRKVTANQAKKILDEQLQQSENNKTPQIKQNVNAKNRELERRVKALAKKHETQSRKIYMKQHRINEKEARQQIKDNAFSKLDSLLRSGVITKSEYDLFKKGTK